MRKSPGRFHQSLFGYENARWLWTVLLLGLFCTLLYAIPNYDQPANGGTWQGYILGSAAASMIFWLMWLGIRKRSYARSRIRYQGWVSAHIYIGLVLLLVATLHTGFQFGFNVHTLAYGLMAMVIISGVVGAWSYRVLPARQSRLRNNLSREALLLALNEVDSQCLRLAKKIHPDVAKVVTSTLERTVLGGGVWHQITGRDYSQIEVRGGQGNSTAQNLVNNRNQSRIIELIASRIALSPGGKEAVRLQELLWLFARRKNLLQTLRSDIRLQGWMQIWLGVHVPLSFALLAALLIHVFSVFYYW